MSKTDEVRIFGRQRKQHVLILASGEKIRHMTVSPVMASAALGLAGFLVIAYLLATSYLVLRDDLIGGSMARQARMQHDYEDRIAALRAQVDRVTSRQLLDQQVVEDKLDRLLERQTALSSRSGKLGSLLDRAENAGLDLPPGAAAFSSSAGASGKAPRKLSGGAAAIEALIGKTHPAGTAQEGASLTPSAFASPAGETQGERADRLFSHVTLSLKTIEEAQKDHVTQLTQSAETTAGAISRILRGLDIRAPLDTRDDSSAMGGPLVEPDAASSFDLSLGELDGALDRLDRMRRTAEALPFRNPAVGKDMTSPFGERRDPFLGRLALHTGVDFRFAPGEAVHPTAGGTVTTAGFTGGYGNMVEIDHGSGIVTRYGHLSQVLVSVGQTVGRADTIGLAGSTGRSTGTHLHYEVRRNGRAIDPLTFIEAGEELAAYVR